MAAEVVSPSSPGFWSRLGCLVLAPRLLARRDLQRRDGKAGDDLLSLVALAIVVNGASTLVRAASALAAGRTNAALHQLASTVRAVLPLVVVWAVATALLWAFTRSAGKRATGELAARVTSLVVVASLVLRWPVSLLPPSPSRYVLESLPWALGALWFGLVLREALEPLPEPLPELSIDTRSDTPAPDFALPRQALLAGGVLGVLLFCIAATQLFSAHATDDPGITARKGSPAPPIDQPLLGTGQPLLGTGQPPLGTGRFTLVSQQGHPVVLSFWATWCGPCLQELPVLEKIYRQRGSDAPPIYLINVDEPGPERERAVQSIKARLQLTMPIVLDDGSAGRDYSINTIPSIAKIDAQGTLAVLFDRPLDEADLRDLLR